MGEKRRADDDSGSDKKPKSSKKEKKEKNDLDPDEAAAKAERKAAKKAKRDESGGGGGGGEDDGEDAIETVEVECKGQTGRIIGKGGSKIREIEDLTGCILSIDQAKGICTVRGPTVAPAVQEVKNIVQEGRERDELAHAPAPPRARSQSQGWDDAAHDRRSSEPAGVSTPDELPFGKPPAGSASRNDTGQNDWQCPCGSTNFARRSSCFRCRAPRADGVAGGGNAPGGTPPGGDAPVGVGRPTNERTTGPASAARTEAGSAARAPAQGSDADGYEVFVKYLPHTSEEHEVADVFSQFGEILGGVRLIRNPTTGQCKGAGFVTFAHEHARQAALAKDGMKFGGRHLSITVAKTGTFGVRATEQAFGTHTPAMLRETIDALVKPNPNGTYVDGTFGRGGHTRGILAALGPNGRLHAFDMDPEVSARRVVPLSPLFLPAGPRYDEKKTEA